VGAAVFWLVVLQEEHELLAVLVGLCKFLVLFGLAFIMDTEGVRCLGVEDGRKGLLLEGGEAVLLLAFKVVVVGLDAFLFDLLERLVVLLDVMGGVELVALVVLVIEYFLLLVGSHQSAFSEFGYFFL
jgi:hypothetical protein